MWDQKLFEVFTTTIPQSFALILLFFSLLRIKIQPKSFILFSIGIAVIPYFIRPYVNFGVHSIITMMILVVIASFWAKSNVLSSIICSIITFATAYFCEWITFIVLEAIKFDISKLDDDPVLRAIIGFIPFALLLAIGLIAYYFMQLKKEARS